MTDQDAAAAEIRALFAEAIGALRIVSEAAGPLNRANVRYALAEAQQRLELARQLARRLP